MTKIGLLLFGPECGR